MKDGYLTGWKPIANILDVHPQTAIRWYKKYNMPVQRTPSKRPMIELKVLKKWIDEINNEINDEKSTTWEKKISNMKKKLTT